MAQENQNTGMIQEVLNLTLDSREESSESGIPEEGRMLALKVRYCWFTPAEVTI